MVCAGALGIALLAACTDPGPAETAAGGALGSYVVPAGIHKIKHVIVIMQENRSFDSYVGTYPGADGIPMRHGVPTVSVPDPVTSTCIYPFHEASIVNTGGPHTEPAFQEDLAGGAMSGFVTSAETGKAPNCRGHPFNPDCTAARGGMPDVMGYH